MQAATTSSKIPVLIVGAGPVGLAAAIRLRQEGVDVRVVDEQTAEGKRTYPVVLHARTLRLLGSLGVTAPLEWRGRAVTSLAIHTDNLARGSLQLPDAEPLAAGALTLPQDVLRQSLLHRLVTLGVDVEWQTRLTGLDQDAAGARVTLAQRQRVESQRPERRPEWLDMTADTLAARFVIGADGCRSATRQALGIGMIPHGRREFYVFYDAADARSGAEAQLVFCDGLGNSAYPLQGELSRFTFQIGVGASQQPGQAQLEQLLAARMPWHAAGSAGFEWSGSAEFHPALAASFGEGCVWLAGDAAHVTGPLGGQSVNVGLHEADELAARIAHSLHDGSAEAVGARYTEQRRVEWARLFGLGPSQPDVAHAPDWVKRHIAALLPSLPASGDDLDDLLEQLKVQSA